MPNSRIRSWMPNFFLVLGRVFWTYVPYALLNYEILKIKLWMGALLSINRSIYEWTVTICYKDKLKLTTLAIDQSPIYIIYVHTIKKSNDSWFDSYMFQYRNKYVSTTRRESFKWWFDSQFNFPIHYPVGSRIFYLISFSTELMDQNHKKIIQLTIWFSIQFCHSLPSWI